MQEPQPLSAHPHGGMSGWRRSGPRSTEVPQDNEGNSTEAEGEALLAASLPSGKPHACTDRKSSLKVHGSISTIITAAFLVLHLNQWFLDFGGKRLTAPLENLMWDSYLLIEKHTYTQSLGYNSR